jgi:large subunit ribosomal protein L23
VKLHPTQILIAPVVSEKSYHMINERKYCFRIHPDAHKTQVRQAVEAQFEVEEGHREAARRSFDRDLPGRQGLGEGIERDASTQIQADQPRAPLHVGHDLRRRH